MKTWLRKTLSVSALIAGALLIAPGAAHADQGTARVAAQSTPWGWSDPYSYGYGYGDAGYPGGGYLGSSSYLGSSAYLGGTGYQMCGPYDLCGVTPAVAPVVADTGAQVVCVDSHSRRHRSRCYQTGGLLGGQLYSTLQSQLSLAGTGVGLAAGINATTSAG
jgi:hypothetical protein